MKLTALSRLANVALASLLSTSIVHAADVDVLLFGMPYTQGLSQLADDFEEKTGLTANIEVVGQDVFENRITLSFTGKTGDIDVVHTPVIQVQRWVEAGWIQPLTDGVEAMADRDDILAGPLDAYLVKGDYWGVPFFAETGMMAYRKDLLSAAGFEAPPATWSEVLDAAKAMKTDDVAGFAMRAAPGQGFNMFVFPMIMRAYGGKFFANYPDDLTPAINSAETLEALNLYIDLINNYGPAGGGNFNFAEIAASSQAGKLAMFVDGTSIAAQSLDPAKSQVAEHMAVAPVPTGPEGRSPTIAVHGLGIPADAPNAEASFKFIEWATSTETLTKIALMQPYPDFTRASVAADPEVTAKYASINPDFLSLRVDMLNQAIGHYRPLLPQWPQLGAAIGEHINAAVNGLETPEEALAAAEEEMADIMAE